MDKILPDFPGWRIINTGDLLWSKKDPDTGKPALQPLMRRGDFAPCQVVVDSLTKIITEESDAKGFFVTGFPRDEVQATVFETKVREELFIC